MINALGDRFTDPYLNITSFKYTLKLYRDPINIFNCNFNISAKIFK